MCTRLSALDLTIQGRIDELYDDNINQSATEPESDMVTNLMLGMGLVSETKGFELSLLGNVYQQIYVKNHDKNRNYQDLLLSLGKNFSETINFNIVDTFQHYPESLSFGTLFGQNEENRGYISNSVKSELSVYVTKELFFTGIYTNTIVNNDSNALTDTVLNNPGGSIGYSFNSANIIRLGYNYSLMKYNNGEESRGQQGYAEYEKYYTRQLRSVLLGGCDYIKASTQEKSLSSRWMLSVIDDVDKNNQLNISFLKEKTISNIVADTFNNWRVTGLLKHELSERTGINISFFFGEGTYDISQVTNSLIGASTSFAFTVTEFIDFNIGYNYTWNNSSSPGLDDRSYSRNQVFAGLSGTY